MNRIHRSVATFWPDRSTCTGTPMRVVDDPSADGLVVCIDARGELRLVETEFLGSVAPGDRVLVHADVAIARTPQLV